MKSKLSRVAAFVLCMLLALSVAVFAMAEGDAAAASDAAATTADTAATDTAAATEEVSMTAQLLSTFVPMILIVVVFWVFLIRPQRKKDKKIKEMLAALKVGDRVCTIGGIYGTITNIRDENTVTLAVGPQDVPVVFARWAIRNVEEITVENDTEVLA
jgi:preprotein translocase subunit YajC